MTALRLAVLWLDDRGGSENGPWLGVGESTMMVLIFESCTVEEVDRAGEATDSVVDFALVATFFTLPTRTTMARAGVAV